MGEGGQGNEHIPARGVIVGGAGGLFPKICSKRSLQKNPANQLPPLPNDCSLEFWPKLPVPQPDLGPAPSHFSNLAPPSPAHTSITVMKPEAEADPGTLVLQCDRA